MKKTEIIINGKTFFVENTFLTFYIIVAKAKGVMHRNFMESYTVTFSKGENNASGIMNFNDKVNVCKGMIFNVHKTVNA